jgi:hypothetical protein
MQNFHLQLQREEETLAQDQAQHLDDSRLKTVRERWLVGCDDCGGFDEEALRLGWDLDRVGGLDMSEALYKVDGSRYST